MAHDVKNIFPNPEQALFFRRSYATGHDLWSALREFKREFGIEDSDRWCTLNAVLVAEAAILDNMEAAYSVESGKASTSKGGSHVAGSLGGSRYDLAAMQYGPDAEMTYSPAPAHFRTSYLEAAQDALSSIEPRERLKRTAQAISRLLKLKNYL